MSDLGEHLRHELGRMVPDPSPEILTEAWFDDKADELISDFIWAQRSLDWPKVRVAIDSALTLVKFLRENNFLSVHTKDFDLTHKKLDSYWANIEKSLLKKRGEIKPKNTLEYGDLYEIVKACVEQSREMVFSRLDLDAKVKERVLVHFGVSPERYT